ncbi:hypothetical protein ABH926_008498 [Catenulispora sp. GP43]|uniref:DUF5988 family protein n=1 Tax=Catenulispora sp. GP43 TaxID=3156263 RepID=UPI0035169635
MSSDDKAVLEGGPEELAGRIVPIETPGSDLKIPFRNGYEHFRATSRHADTAEGELAVYEWWERTESPA